MGRPTRASEMEHYKLGWKKGQAAALADIRREEPATQAPEGLSRGAHWFGRHRGLSFRANQHWKLPEPDAPQEVPAWCFYVYVLDDALAGIDVEDVQRVHGWARECNWAQSIAKDGRTVHELGCDYSHIGDEGQTYDAAGVAADARRTIDAILAEFPGLLVNHWWSGLVTQERWAELEAERTASRAAAEEVKDV